MSEVVKLNEYDIKDLRAVRTYENVTAMKSDTKLRENQHVKTKGYYEAGDGGSAEYIIVYDETLVDDGGSIHELNNGLKAKIINIDKITPELYGAYGDGEHDDTISIQKAIDSCNNIEFNTVTYKISDSLYLDNYSILNGNNCTIYNTSTHPALRGNNKHNIIIKNFTITDNNTSDNQHGIYLTGDNHLVDNCTIDNVTGDGIYLANGKNQIVQNCKIIDSKRISLFSFEGDNTVFKNIYIHGGGHKYVCQFKSCINSTMDTIKIVEGSEISCLSTKQLLSENPNAITPSNNTITNIKIINHGITWDPEDENKVAILLEGDNYNVSNIMIKDSYTGGIKTEVNNSIIKDIIIDGYGLDGGNNLGAYLTDATDYGKNNVIENIVIKNGSYQGLRTHLFNSTIKNVNIIDCGTSSQPQFASADKNSVIDNIILETKLVDCRGIAFNIGELTADNSSYTNIKRIKAEGHTQYDFVGSSWPLTIYIKSDDTVKWNGGRGVMTCPFEYNKGIVTMYNRGSGTSSITGVTGDTIYFNPSTKVSTGYAGKFYNGTEWVDIISLSNS